MIKTRLMVLINLVNRLAGPCVLRPGNVYFERYKAKSEVQRGKDQCLSCPRGERWLRETLVWIRRWLWR